MVKVRQLLLRGAEALPPITLKDGVKYHDGETEVQDTEADTIASPRVRVYANLRLPVLHDETDPAVHQGDKEEGHVLSDL